MAQYVMTSGTVWMPELSVDNWDSMTLVCDHILFSVFNVLPCLL